MILVLGSQPAGDVSHKPGGRLPLLSARPAEGCYQFCCLVNRGTMGVNSLPKTVTRQRSGCDLNAGPSAPESSTLTTWLPSHPATMPYSTGMGSYWSCSQSARLTWASFSYFICISCVSSFQCSRSCSSRLSLSCRLTIYQQTIHAATGQWWSLGFSNDLQSTTVLLHSSLLSSSSRSRRGPSRRCTTMSKVDSTPPELSSRTGGIVS